LKNYILYTIVNYDELFYTLVVSLLFCFGLTG